MMKRKKNEGFTLVELLIVVAAIGVLSALVLNGMSRANQSSLAKRLNDEISLIAAQATAWRGASTAYTGVSMSVLEDQGMLKDGMGDTGNNPAGGDYTVAVNGSDVTRVNIAATNLDVETCNNVAHKMSGIAVSATCTGTAPDTLTVVME